MSDSPLIDDFVRDVPTSNASWKLFCAMAAAPMSIQRSRIALRFARFCWRIDATKDIRKLQACLDLLQTETMPCVFSEEEFDEEIKASEQSGFATEEEVRTAFAKWGVYK